MNEIVKIKDDRGQELQITPDDVRNVLCPSANDKEIAMFLELCRAQNLNPFIKDAYLVKYGSAPATIITGKEVFTKRAAKNKSYKGFESGITVQRGNSIERREGSAVFDGEKLLGGWARVHVDGKHPFFDEVAFSEYSSGKSNWATKPGTMIRKVALVHALREAFPDDFQGLYSAEEMSQDTPQVVQVAESQCTVLDTAEVEHEQVATRDEKIHAEYVKATKDAVEAGIKREGIMSWFESRFGHAMGKINDSEKLETIAWCKERTADANELGINSQDNVLMDDDIKF